MHSFCILIHVPPLTSQARPHTHTHAHAPTRTGTHTRTHTHIHTHTHTRPLTNHKHSSHHKQGRPEGIFESGPMWHQRSTRSFWSRLALDHFQYTYEFTFTHSRINQTFTWNFLVHLFESVLMRHQKSKKDVFLLREFSNFNIMKCVTWLLHNYFICMPWIIRMCGKKRSSHRALDHFEWTH